MIAATPRPFIFIHIPKCAGTSLEAVLIPLATQQPRIEDLSEEERDRFWLPGKGEKQHLKLRDFSRQYPLREYFKFAIVRNPWDRTISQIEFLLKGRYSREMFTGANSKENIEIYCHSTERPGNQDLSACQLDYLLDDSGRVGVDYIGRFENLAADFRQICTHLGLAPPPVLPHFKNAQRPFHYSEFYDDESVEWVRRRFARDIDYFGYTFEGPPAPAAGETPGKP